MTPHTPHSSLFPYTTLFRSRKAGGFRTTANQGKGDLNQDCVIGYLRRRNVCDNGRTAPDEHLLQGTPFADRKSTRLNSSHRCISYAVFCLKKKKRKHNIKCK